MSDSHIQMSEILAACLCATWGPMDMRRTPGPSKTKLANPWRRVGRGLYQIYRHSDTGDFAWGVDRCGGR
jgi:hypothetical protein